jgi:adenosine deaminase
MVDEFRALPKIDAHNHLSLGMRYPEYRRWAGTALPDFHRQFADFAEMDKVIEAYTRPRCKTAQDVADICALSIEAAIADGVTVLEGSVDIAFVSRFGDGAAAVDRFVRMAAELRGRYAGKIDFRPELGMEKLLGSEKIAQWAQPCLQSGVFKSIDLYGPEVEEGIEGFRGIFALAGRLGIKRKAHAGEFSGAASVRHLAELFDLEEVQHGIGAASDESVMQFLKDRNIRLNVCPASNVRLSAVPSLAAHPVKRLVEAGVRVSIGTDDLLFFDKSVSEQCAELAAAGALTLAQIRGLFG